MSTIRNDTNSISRGKNNRVDNLRISVQMKTKDIVPLKFQNSPVIKQDSESSLRRNSSKKLKTAKDEKINEETNEIEFLKNKLDKLPTKRVYFKKYNSDERNRINKQINNFLNCSDNNDNNAPTFLNKLKMIRNSSLPFITINSVDMSVLKVIHPISDIIHNYEINIKDKTTSRNHSNSFDNVGFNFKKEFTLKKNFFSACNTIKNDTNEVGRNERLDITDDSELMHFLQDLNENTKDKYKTTETKVLKSSENEIKTLENCQDSFLEL